MKQEFMAAENSPVECLSRAKSLVNHWRREHGPDEGKALADAREAYLKCIAVIDSSEDDLNVRAQVGLAKLELVAGDPASTRSGLARLSEALRDHPYSNSIEDVIYLLAIQAAFPSTGQTSAAATGALEYLDYLRESYAPAHEGAPTASLYPHWDSNEDVEGERKQDPSLACAADNWGGQGLHVNGLPAWALQFQIGLLASRMGNSTRGMETMENAFTSYEAWLPRSLGGFNDDIPDVDAIRRCWYHGLAHWTDWVQHPRTWLDMGDISYRQGPGYFHVAAEAYRGALQRAGDVFRPDQQEAIAYRIAKCCSRYGDITGAIAGIEQLLYTRNFWSERYRNHLKAWSEAWREHFLQEDMASLRLQCFWRMTAAKMELHFLRAQDRLVQEYTELKRRNVLKHRFRGILEYCREKKRLSKFATDIQCMYRVRNARTIASTLRAVRDFKEAIVQAHVSKLIRNFQVLCFKHWVQHHGLVRLDKAATKIQNRWHQLLAREASIHVADENERVSRLLRKRNERSLDETTLELRVYPAIKTYAKQALLRGKKARVLVQSMLTARKSQARLEQLVEEMQYKFVTRRCMRRLSKQVAVGRRERAATTIQAMARGVVGRELASDERNRQARIQELLLKALERLGMPVLREWYKAAHDMRKARMATKIQARWRTFRARRKWTITKTKVSRARAMGIEAIGRHRHADQRRVFERWKHVVLVRKVVTVQRKARYQRRVREYAFEEWRFCVRCDRVMTKLAARFRGCRARKAFAERMSLLGARQDALCRVGLSKMRLYLAVAVREWSDYCWCCEVFSVFQAKIRGWQARRRLTTIKVFARRATNMLVLDGVMNYRYLNVKCSVGQAAWRGSIARGRHHRVLTRARMVGEICARVRDARRRRMLDTTLSTWRSTLLEEKRMATRLQSVARGRSGRARACLIRAHERWRDNLVMTFQREVRRRCLLRCFRAIETCLVDAYTTALRSFLSHEKKQAAVRGENCRSVDNGKHARHEASKDGGKELIVPNQGECALHHGTNTVAAPSADEDPRHHVPASSKQNKNGTQTTSNRPRCAGKSGAPRRPHRDGRDIVWEEGGHGEGCKHRDLVACGLWKTTWMAARERSTSFVSSAFFRAFDEVRRMAVLSWLPDRLSYHELAFLCRFAMVISLKHGSAVEVWKLVKVLRQASVARVNETHSPAEVSVSQATVTPAIVICNGDCADKIGELGQAVAALVDGGYCSSLSITACSIGNVGAVALAKACCRETLEELCLESCDIGNAGAAALLVALGEGLSAGLRKLVLSGNRVGGSIIFARALRNVMTRSRECSLEVLELSRCSLTDSDMAALCKGLADVRCRIRLLLMSNNVDLRDRGANVLAETLRTRSEVRARAHRASLQVDLERCSIHTWGCLALAACVLDADGAESEGPLVLNLGNNLIKDYGVEAMSCATLGQDYNDHRTRQSQEHRRLKSPLALNRVRTNTSTTRAIPHGTTNEANARAQHLRCQDKQFRCASATKQTWLDGTQNLPPLKGTPLYAAATAAAAWSGKYRQSPRRSYSPGLSAWSVVLDGNQVSERVVAGQDALAGMGEAALFRGCVLPETVAVNKSRIVERCFNF